MARKVSSVKDRVTRALRMLWLRSPERYSIVKNARIGPNLYQCELCNLVGSMYSTGMSKGKIKKTVNFEVDHIELFAKCDDWNLKIERLFDVDNMRLVCKQCNRNRPKPTKKTT